MVGELYIGCVSYNLGVRELLSVLCTAANFLAFVWSLFPLVRLSHGLHLETCDVNFYVAVKVGYMLGFMSRDFWEWLHNRCFPLPLFFVIKCLLPEAA